MRYASQPLEKREAMTSTTEASLRALAAQHDQDATDSFERCDTDGFLSQWASGCNAALARMKADLIARGGVAEFPALLDLDGDLVPAKLINGRYGQVWAVFATADDAESRSGDIIKWVTAFPARESTMTRKGYAEGWVEVPAYCELVGSSATNVSPRFLRSDGGYSRNAKVVEGS